jgi:iron-sulfur cluster repair protein YtfE (RIC family)
LAATPCTSWAWITDGWGERTVGDVVAEDYGRAAIFQRYGIDFCCGGGRTVRSACEGRRRAGTGEDVGRPGAWPLDVLTAHIVSEHHCTTYRATYAKLAEFEADLHRHVHLENNVLFPRALAAAEVAGSTRG